MMTQLDIFAMNVMGASTRSFNGFDAGGVNPKRAKFDALYKKQISQKTKEEVIMQTA